MAKRTRFSPEVRERAVRELPCANEIPKRRPRIAPRGELDHRGCSGTRNPTRRFGVWRGNHQVYGARKVWKQLKREGVVAKAASRADVIALARTHQPDVVVLDISMPDGTGLSAIGELRAAAPNVRVLILSIHDHEQYVIESVRAGAQGYLRKDSSPAELRVAVRAVHRGESFFSTAVAGRLASGLRQEATRQERAERLAVLSAREREVLIGVASGQTNKEIAAALDISPRTVESHRESLMRKLDIRSVAGLTKLAVEEGLLANGA